MSFDAVNEKKDISILDIWKIVTPLVISALSANLLFLIDRFVLLRYSEDAMNSAALGGNLAAIYTMIIICITGTSEVFVGQFNGAGKRKSTPIPVWQMIYFSLISLVILFPLGFFAEHINLIPEYYAKDGVAYQKILTYCAWLPGLSAALTGFFVGRGKTKIVTIAVICGSLANLVLDILLVFGYKNLVPPMGCCGAAIATVMAQIVQVAILGTVFWSRKNRLYFSTFRNRSLNKKIMMRCINIGLPSSLGHGINLLAWYLIYAALSRVSKELSTIHGIAVTVNVLFEFICEGIIKGTAAISANLIGQRNLGGIRRAVKKLALVALTLSVFSTAPVLLYQAPSFYLLDCLRQDISHLYPTISIIFRIIFCIAVLDSLVAVMWGTLISGGDAKFPNLINLTCLWAIVVFPVLILRLLGKLHSTVVVYGLVAVWEATILVLLIKRYKTFKWYKSVIN